MSGKQNDAFHVVARLWAAGADVYRLNRADCADELARLHARRTEFIKLVGEIANQIKE